MIELMITGNMDPREFHVWCSAQCFYNFVPTKTKQEYMNYLDCLDRCNALL